MKKTVLSLVAIAAIGMSAGAVELNVADMIKQKKAEIEAKQAEEKAAIENGIKQQEAYKQAKEAKKQEINQLKENQMILSNTINEDVVEILKSLIADKENFVTNAYVIDKLIANKDFKKLNEFVSFKIAKSHPKDAVFTTMNEIMAKRLDILNSKMNQNLAMVNGTLYDNKEAEAKKERKVEKIKEKETSKFFFSKKNKEARDNSLAASDSLATSGIDLLFLKTEFYTVKNIQRTFKITGNEDLQAVSKVIEEIKNLMPNEFAAVGGQKLRTIGAHGGTIWEINPNELMFESLFNFESFRVNLEKECTDSAKSFWNDNLDNEKANQCMTEGFKKANLGDVKLVPMSGKLTTESDLSPFFINRKIMSIDEALNLVDNAATKEAGEKKLLDYYYTSQILYEREEERQAAAIQVNINHMIRYGGAGFKEIDRYLGEFQNPSFFEQPMLFKDVVEKYKREVTWQEKLAKTIRENSRKY